jgi:hypothetical protein
MGLKDRNEPELAPGFNPFDLFLETSRGSYRGSAEARIREMLGIDAE